jgi:hypothetical protein
MWRLRCLVPALVLLLAWPMLGCGALDREAPQDVVCGEVGDYLWNLNDIQGLDGCTRYRGSIHVSESGLTDLQSLPSLRAVDGSYTFFRNDSLLSLRGLEDLEVVGGEFKLSTHALLDDLSALSSFRSVGGDFVIHGNFSLHNMDAQALADQIAIGGSIDIDNNSPR